MEGRRHAQYRQVPKRSRNDCKTSAPKSPVSTKNQKRSKNSACYAPLLVEETAEIPSLNNMKKSCLKSLSDKASTTDIRSTTSMKFIRLPSLRWSKGSNIPTKSDSFLAKLTLKLKCVQKPSADVTLKRDTLSYMGTSGSNSSLEKTCLPSWDDTITTNNDMSCNTTYLSMDLDEEFEKEHEQHQEYPMSEDQGMCHSESCSSIPSLSLFLDDEDVVLTNVEEDMTIVKEYKTIDIIAPPGKLGFILVNPVQPEPMGPSFVYNIRNDSPLISLLQLEDKILALDDEDVTDLSAESLSKLLVSKSSATTRKITILRESKADVIHNLLWDQAPVNNSMLDLTITKDAADSVIAWGCLVALLGSPAPRSVRKQKKQTPVTSLAEDDINDCILCYLPQGDDDGLENDVQALDLNVQYDDTADDIPSIGDLAPDEAVDYFPTTPMRAQRDIADSTLAWSIVGAILGSPAPSVVSRKRSQTTHATLLDDSPVPEIEDQYDLNDDAIDMTELVHADEDANVMAVNTIKLGNGGDGNENVESVLAWTALGMLLGSPAPKSVCKKKIDVGSEVVAKNHWTDFDAAAGNDHLDEVPVISINDEDINPFFMECQKSAQFWLDGCSHDQDSVPSLSRTMSGASDGEDGYYSL